MECREALNRASNGTGMLNVGQVVWEIFNNGSQDGG